jgi:hypothetical protein
VDSELKKNLGAGANWIRLAYMLIFAVILYFVCLAFWLLAALQLMFVLISGVKNIRLLAVGDSLCQYLTQCFRFISFNSEEKPFPFQDWPVSAIQAEVETAAATESEIEENDKYDNEGIVAPETDEDSVEGEMLPHINIDDPEKD